MFFQMRLSQLSRQMSLSSLQLITLDMTGTVINFRKPVFQEYANVAQLHGVQVSPDTILPHFLAAWSQMNKTHPHFGSTSNKTSREWWIDLVHITFQGSLGNSYSFDSVDPVAEHLYKHYSSAEAYRTFPDAISFLREARRKSGIKIGGLTNFDGRIVSVAEELGVLSLLDFMVYSEEARSSKPDAEIFTKAVEVSGIRPNPENILHIGDDLQKDFQGAKNLGWNAALLDRSEDTPDRSTFGDLEELLRFINK